MSMTEGEIFNDCLQHAFDRNDEKAFMDIVNRFSRRIDNSIPREKAEDSVSSILKALENDPSALAVSIRATLNSLIGNDAK